MNFSPLLSYLAGQGVDSHGPSALAAESDWGIEDALPPPPSLRSLQLRKYSHGLMSPTSHSSIAEEKNFLYFYSRHGDHPIKGSTLEFSKYIHKYLSLANVSGPFVEKFKYNLVVSDFMDDTMIFSKNESSLNTLLYNSADHPPRYHRMFSALQLLMLERRYVLHFPRRWSSSGCIVRLVHLIIFLLKQNLTPSSLSHQNRLKMFKVLLISATRAIQARRLPLLIHHNKLLNQLNEFLIANYKVNKKLISGLITLREQELFESPLADQQHLLEHALSFLVLNLKASIRKLLPYMNGEVFEKFCQLHNVDIAILEDVTDDSDRAVLRITRKLAVFNRLRKFLVCELLTIDEPPLPNFFLSKLCDLFSITSKHFASSLETYGAVSEMFSSHIPIVNAFVSVFELTPAQTSNITHQDILSDNVLNPPNEETNLSHLIAKLSNLTTNLKFFQKYNDLIHDLNNVDEFNEKLMIFNQFNEEISHIKDLYGSTMREYQNEIYLRFNVGSPVSTPSTSKRSSLNEPFNPKSFHTPSIKKRFSLPTHSEPPVPEKRSDKKYKRLSMGLPHGLLTVFEEKGRPQRTTSAYDDNYINILPPTGYESYNQAALESLNKRINSRFSVNSMNSNVSGLSDLLASTQVTSFDEDDNVSTSRGNLTTEELKRKLEESYNRIYSLEDENLRLKGKELDEEDLTISKPSEHFLSQLEKTLDQHT